MISITRKSLLSQSGDPSMFLFRVCMSVDGAREGVQLLVDYIAHYRDYHFRFDVINPRARARCMFASSPNYIRWAEPCCLSRRFTVSHINQD